ncbi:hypothetical protein V496_01677 [Pseudogymnoascus sp. VKM F-4515 (FW-2607)]|nr:hypothetical protein V496_01677 [Pseudogymnoascus sp. VKM F-4515 (FW-2607)]
MDRSTIDHPPSTPKIELHNAYICYVRDAASGSDRKCCDTSLSPHIPCAAELSGGEVVTCTAAEDEQIRSVSQQTSDPSDLSTISVSPTAKTPDTPLLLAGILVYGSYEPCPPLPPHPIPSQDFLKIALVPRACQVKWPPERVLEAAHAWEAGIENPEGPEAAGGPPTLFARCRKCRNGRLIDNESGDVHNSFLS